MILKSVGRLFLAAVLAVGSFGVINVSPVSAQEQVFDYFSFTYDIELSQTEIEGSEPFSATITGEATCTQDLPVAGAITEAVISGLIRATHQSSGAVVILNSGYTINISPFPDEAGETAQGSITTQLQFPDGSQAGTYTLIAETVEAKVRIPVIGWLDYTSWFPQYKDVGVVTYTAPGSGGTGGGGGGGGGGDGAAGITVTRDVMTENGRFTEDVTAKSTDNKVKLDISRNTIGKTRTGGMLTRISVLKEEQPVAPPSDSQVIGLVYDLGPDGATFEPPITVTFKYDDRLMPEGFGEEKLVLALWSESTGWVELESTVDPAANTISASIGHFSVITVIAHQRTARFTASNLTVATSVINLGQTLDISVVIANSGDIAGSHNVELKVDDVVVQSGEVTLAGGDSQSVRFNVLLDTVGEHKIKVEGLQVTIRVNPPQTPANFNISQLTISPSEVEVGEEVGISVMVINTGSFTEDYAVSLIINDGLVETKGITLDGGAEQQVTFSIIREMPGTYNVAIDGVSGMFTVTAVQSLPGSSVSPSLPSSSPATSPPPTFNRWIIGGIFGAYSVMAVFIAIIIGRRRAW